MYNANITYRVTGRYMHGQNVTAYHLVGSDGSQLKENKERIIYLIRNGYIENMRIQTVDNQYIIRGKGINLNNLPVFDEGKQQFRNDTMSQHVANSSVQPKRDYNVNPMGQYTITKRIMNKNTCLGYVIVDHSGKETRVSRSKTIELAIKKLISNATAQKYKRPDSDKPDIILRGAGCDLGKLPILIIGADGKVIDPMVEKQGLTVRAAVMKQAGIIYDNIHNKRLPFESGDFILCNANGSLTPIKREQLKQEFTIDTSTNTATCDDYLANLANFSIEIFGTKPRVLSPENVLTWRIVKPA